jgi:hypothetical protein
MANNSTFIDYCMMNNLYGSYTFQTDDGLEESWSVYNCSGRVFAVGCIDTQEQDYEYDDYRMRKGKRVINADPITLEDTVENDELSVEHTEQDNNNNKYVGLTQQEIRKLERKRIMRRN